MTDLYRAAATVAVDKTADRKDTLPDSLGGAWDRGADFVARHPGMSAEYVRAANPFRTSELAHMREARDNARAAPAEKQKRMKTHPFCAICERCGNPGQRSWATSPQTARR